MNLRCDRYCLLQTHVKGVKVNTSDTSNRDEVMSTKERFGTLVWDALAVMLTDPDRADNEWFGVGEVAKQADVSKVTARKYLEQLEEMGNVKSVRVGSAVGYRPCFK